MIAIAQDTKHESVSSWRKSKLYNPPAAQTNNIMKPCMGDNITVYLCVAIDAKKSFNMITQ